MLANTPIERVSEGNETQSFKAEFTVWDPPRSFGMGSKASTTGSGEFSVCVCFICWCVWVLGRYFSYYVGYC